MPRYVFDVVFGPDSTQEEVYTATTKHLVDNVMKVVNKMILVQYFLEESPVFPLFKNILVKQKYLPLPGLQRDSVRVRGDGWREDVHDGGGPGQPGHHGARPARPLRRRGREQQKGDETPRLLETMVLLV